MTIRGSDNNTGVVVQRLTASWSMDINKLTLNDISFKIDRVMCDIMSWLRDLRQRVKSKERVHSIVNMFSQAHSLLAIIGPVGAGKVNNLFLVFIIIFCITVYIIAVFVKRITCSKWYSIGQGISSIC